jgi:cyclopropane-fatty-acyl-phospholipid synthase
VNDFGRPGFGKRIICGKIPVEMSVSAETSPPPRRFRWVERILKENWRFGALTFALPGGREVELTGAPEGPAARLTVRDYHFLDRVFSRGLLGFGEGYMAGEWDSPDISALLLAFSRNLDRLDDLIRGNRVMRWVVTGWHKLNANTRRGAKRNIEAHYDLGNEFYGLWLDPSMTYSSGRYDNGAVSLIEAQTQKYAALSRLIDLKEGDHVLEIGCGWGGFAEHAARDVGAKVTGITLSPAQLEFARARMEREGLAGQVDLWLTDYRDMEGQYDAIASIEMFEAVGEAWWPTYFRKVSELLKPGGKAGLQIITIRDNLFETYKRRADFIQRYIFPGGMLPPKERLMAEIAAAGLELVEVEFFSDDYGKTLLEWRKRFEAQETRIKALGFDQRFMRMWRFYLAYCEAGFRTRRTEVGQWIIRKPL